MKILILLLAVGSSFGSIDLSKIKLPKGFRIQIAAEKVKNARQMAISDKGVLFVGTKEEGSVYALEDKNKDGVFETKHTLAKDLYMPNAVAYKGGDLYIAEINKISKIKDVHAQLGKNYIKIGREIIFDKLPAIRHHGWKYIAFGPKGLLYIPIGAPCNICLKDDKQFATIHTLNLKTGVFRVYAEGVRNSVGMDWHPTTNELWFTDNGRDLLGDDKPDCELNKATERGQHFGYPFYHGKGLLDPTLGHKKPKDFKYVAPQMEMGAHVAPLGLKFYNGKMFPERYRKGFFVAQHGSWNRSKKSGYNITYVRLNKSGTKAIRKQIFIEGFMRGEETFGRPVDIVIDKDGSLLISDDYANNIYRVTYSQ